MEPRALPLLLLLQNVWSSAYAKAPVRRRGLLELEATVRCSTGRSGFAYIAYGCYCGLGGQGWPKDATDWCCHKHDCCYEKAALAGCSPKMTMYDWTCEDNTVKCDNLEDKCHELICKCDSESATCLRNAPFQPKLVLWPDFLCGHKYPTCSYH
ncbi:phospholipase A2-like [Lissotriton helveticus]